MYESGVGRSVCGVGREAVRVTCHLHMLHLPQGTGASIVCGTEEAFLVSNSSGLVHLCLHSHCVCGGPVPDKKEPNVHRVAACGWDTSVGVVSSHTHCYFHSKGTYKGGIFSNLSVCLLKAAVWAWFKVVAQYSA